MNDLELMALHCDALYESLYDLLNQHYMEFSGQRYRITFRVSEETIALFTVANAELRLGRRVE